MSGSKSDDVLEGTTRKVFRFVYRQHEPVGIHDIQRGLGLSSPSVAYYHVGKLVKSGLIKEEGSGYVADKFVFENMVRVRKTALPLQSAYAVLFLAALALLVTILRPAQITSQYAFSVVMIVIGFGISAFEAYRTLSKEIL